MNNSERIAKDLELILLRYRKGLLSLREAREEVGFQMALLKAQEQAVLEKRLERLEAVVEERKRW